MKKVLVAAVALALGIAWAPSSAFAEPARASSASAYGLTVNLLGGQLIAPTPTVAASQPPDSIDREPIIPIDLDPVAQSGTGVTVAEATRADTITGERLAVARGNDNKAVTLQGVSARGYAGLESANVLVNQFAELPVELDQLTLVEADAIEAEAVAKCVDNQPQFDYGYNLLNLELGDTPVTAIEDVIDGIIELPGPLSDLGVIDFDTPRTNPNMVTRTPTGIAVTALRVALLPALGEDPLVEVVIGHAEARMPTPCGIEQPRPPTGPGPAAPALAATGDDMGTWPLMAFGVLGGAVILRRTMVLRSRRAS